MTRPAGEYKYGGIKCTIWKNEFEVGKYTYRAQISKSYKDKDGNFKETSQFTLTECLALSKLLEKAFNEFGVKETDDFAFKEKE
jgi:hypothetical protein